MNLDAIIPHLNEKRAAQLPAIVAKLEAAIAAGVVPNTLMNDAKWIINDVCNKSADAFLATGPRSDQNSMSTWWNATYAANAFVSGATNITTAINRTAKIAELKEYHGFLKALLPLHTMLQAAKPLIAKRGDNRLPPKPKTAEQIAKEARQMTCQCCGRLHLANTGVVAHHGYQRPGFGWQTASCIGARELPFEVARDRLGQHINLMKARRDDMISNRDGIELETIGFNVDYATNERDHHGRSIYKRVEVTREIWDAVKAEHDPLFSRYGRNGSFDEVKARKVDDCNRNIKNINEYINHQQARYDGWKQTHSHFDSLKDEWIKL